MPYTRLSVRKFEKRYQDLLDYIENPNYATLQDKKAGLISLPDKHPLKNKSLFVVNGENGKSFLHLAAAQGKQPLIHFLINTGHDINLRDNQHKTPLYDACANLQLQSVDILLNYRADADFGNSHIVVAIDEQGYRGEKLALVAAIESKVVVTDTENTRAAIVRKLIAAGADVNLQTGEENFSALHYAVTNRKPLIVQEIVNSGKANFRLVDRNGETALHRVADYRSKEEKEYEQPEMQEEKAIAELIIPHLEAIDVQDKFGNTPLHTAVIRSNLYVVKTIYQSDYKFTHLKILTIQNSEGNTAIHEAVKEADRGPKVLQFLLGVATVDDLAIPNSAGETAEKLASRLQGEVKQIRELIEEVEHSTELFAATFYNAVNGKISVHDTLIKLRIAIGNLEQYEPFDTQLKDFDNVPFSSESRLDRLSRELSVLPRDLEDYEQYDSLLETDAAKLLQRAQQLIDDIEDEFQDNFFSDSYLETLNSVKQEDYFAWKDQQLELPSSFSLQKRDHEFFKNLNELNQIAARQLSLGEEALSSGNFDQAIAIINEGIQSYADLKSYLDPIADSSLESIAYQYLERAYQVLAEAKLQKYFLNPDTSIIQYEAENQAKLRSPSTWEKLQGHLALAGLYKKIREQGLAFASGNDLFIHESFHYHKAYQCTQGDLDSTAYVVLQREIGVATDKKLGTYNIQQCVAVVAFEPMSRKVVLSHFDRFSGPSSFIEQLLKEFPENAKLKLYISGGRDRSRYYNEVTKQYVDNKRTSDNNIDQVLKQIYAKNKENAVAGNLGHDRLQIEACDVGDKLSPQAIVFDMHAASGPRLVHAMPNYADGSLELRVVGFLQQKIKGDYLRPLNPINLDQIDVERVIQFTPAQRKTIFAYSLDDFRYAGVTAAWNHDQNIYPIITVQNKLAGKSEPDFQQGLIETIFNRQSAHGQSLPYQLVQESQHDHQDLMGIDSDDSVDETMDWLSQDYADAQSLQRQLDSQELKCLSKRRKREANDCILDGEAVLEKLVELSEVEQVKILQQLATRRVGGMKRKAVLKLVMNQKRLNHLQKVGRFSSELMQGMIAQDTLSALFRGDGKTVAINFGFISTGSGLAKLSELAVAKGETLLQAGKPLLGKALLAAAPFLKRSTSAFFVFDLANQIKALASGNKDAIKGVVGDSLIVGSDLAVAGIEVAETFGLIEGVAEVAGPVGEVISTLVMLGIQIAAAVESVTHLDTLVHLTDWERFKEGWRAFLGISVEQYIQNMADLEQYYQQVLPEKLQWLQNQTMIKDLVFTAPTVKKINCREVVIANPLRNGLLGKGKGQSRKETQCDTEFPPVRDSVIVLSNKSKSFKSARVPVAPPKGSAFICRLSDDSAEGIPVSVTGAYKCDGAIGITDRNKTAGACLFDLAAGDRTVFGYLQQTNLLFIQNGTQKSTVYLMGGTKNDVFSLAGTLTIGATHKIDGREGDDTLDLSQFSSATRPVVNLANQTMIFGNEGLYNSVDIDSIENFVGKAELAESLVVSCATQVLNTQGGSITEPDGILIPENDCNYKLRLALHPNTQVLNRARQGEFGYIILAGQGETTVHLATQSQAQHQFFLNSTIADLQSVVAVVQNQVLGGENVQQNLYLNFANASLCVSAVSPNSTSFRFQDGAELKLGEKQAIYIFYNDIEQPVKAIITDYSPIADRLNATFSFITPANELIILGHSRHEMMMSDPSRYKTHLVGNGGENLFVIYTGSIPLAELPLSRLPLPEVILYQRANNSFIDSLDLRMLTNHNNAMQKAKIMIITPNEQNGLGSDLLLDVFLEGTKKNKELLSIRLQDAAKQHCYENLHIIMHVAPMKIVGSYPNLYLKPIPLVIDDSYEFTIIGADDVEADTQVIVPKPFQQSGFYQHNTRNLLWTNALHSSNNSSEARSIIIKDFFQDAKLQTLSFKFADSTEIFAKNLTNIVLLESFEQASNKRVRALKQKAAKIISTNQRPSVVIARQGVEQLIVEQPKAQLHQHTSNETTIGMNWLNSSSVWAWVVGGIAAVGTLVAGATFIMNRRYRSQAISTGAAAIELTTLMPSSQAQPIAEKTEQIVANTKDAIPNAENPMPSWANVCDSHLKNLDGNGLLQLGVWAQGFFFAKKPANVTEPEKVGVSRFEAMLDANQLIDEFKEKLKLCASSAGIAYPTIAKKLDFIGLEKTLTDAIEVGNLTRICPLFAEATQGLKNINLNDKQMQRFTGKVQAESEHIGDNLIASTHRKSQNPTENKRLIRVQSMTLPEFFRRDENHLGQQAMQNKCQAGGRRYIGW